MSVYVKKITADAIDAVGAVMLTDTSTAGMGFVVDEDDMSSDSATKVPTQQSVKAYVDTTVLGLLDYKGGYDASTNTPDLDTSPSGVAQGDVYVVTAAGTFFTVAVEVGDTLIAEVDSASLEADWTIVQANLTPATIKTQYESNADTNAFTDAEQTKLSGIETAADVTDATNVDAAGAVMEADYTAADVVLVGGGVGSTTVVNLTANTVLGKRAGAAVAVPIGVAAGTDLLDRDGGDGRFAPLAQGVTNGDSHDHAGGDGGQINHANLSNIGTYNHTQIDSHIDAANPHSGSQPLDATLTALAGVSFAADTVAYATAADTFIARGVVESSAGASDSDKLVRLDPTGKLDSSVIPAAGGGTTTINMPIELTTYTSQNVRLLEDNLHGGLTSILTGQTLNSGSPVVVNDGLGKIFLAVIAGSDTSGTITITGTSVDRNTGAETGADTENISISGLTTDNSSTDSNGNTEHDFTNGYISSKWWKGTYTISTSDVNFSDLDVYNIAFEQLNDEPNATVTTLDMTGLVNNSLAWVDAYLYHVQVSGNTASIGLMSGGGATSELHLAGSAVTANTRVRLRKGGLATAVDGSSDGLFLDLFLGPLNQTYWEDINVKIWGTVAQDVSTTLDHNGLSNLTTGDVHTQYMHNDNDRTVTAQHTFSPGVAQPPFVLGANAQDQTVTGLDADSVDGADASATPGATTIPIADGSGKLAAGWGGSANTLATLNGSSLVVENPASASKTAAGDTIPITETGGGLKAEHMGTGTPTVGYTLLGQGASAVPQWGAITAATSGGVSGGTGVSNTAVTETTLANNATVSIALPSMSTPNLSVPIWYQGSAELNQTRAYDFATAGDYTEEDAASGTDTAFGENGEARLHATNGDSDIALYIQGNGDNASTHIFDGLGHALTIGGNVAISTTTPKYGSGCIDFPGSAGDHIRVNMSTELAAAGTDWTDTSWDFECWVRFDSNTGNHHVAGAQVATFDSANYPWLIGNEGGTLRFRINNGTIIGSSAVSTGTWYHVAMSFDDSTNTSYAFLDGAELGSGGAITTAGSPYIQFGQWFGDNFNGQQDDIRVTIKTNASASRYTGAFTAPASEFSDITYPTTGYYITSNTGVPVAEISTFDSWTAAEASGGGSQVRYLVSWDDGSTWQADTGGGWGTVAIGNIHTSGMTAAQLNTAFTGTAPETGTTVQFAWGLKSSDATITPIVNTGTVQWDGPVPWIDGTKGAAAAYFDVTAYTNATAGAFKVKNVSGSDKTVRTFGLVF